MFTKKHAVLAVMAVMALSIAGAKVAQAREDLERLEVPVEAAFAPVEGFDDNDNIEVVLTGYLPNACHSLAESFVEQGEDGSTIAIHQYMLRKTDGVCAQGATLPPHMAIAVPFTVTVPVGRLNAAEYRVEYHGTSGEHRYRPLVVSNASAPTVDSYPYAGVTQVASADLTSARQDTKVRISGVLNSTCVSLEDSVRIVKRDDVFVVLPILKVKENVLCAQALIPFDRELNLGKVSPGKYLVHVRSMNGRALNRVIQVGR